MHSAPRLLLAFAVVVMHSAAPASAQTQAAPPAAESQPSQEAIAAQKTHDQATALKEFEKEISSLTEWMSQHSPGNKLDMATRISVMSELAKKMSAVRTDNLPEDLAGGMKRMAEDYNKMTAIFKDAPEDGDKLANWMAGKFSDPNVRQQLDGLGKELERLPRELKTAGARHGISLDLDLTNERPEKNEKDKTAADAPKKSGGLDTSRTAHDLKVGDTTIAVIPPGNEVSLQLTGCTVTSDKKTGAMTMSGNARITIKVPGKSDVTISGEEFTLVPQK